MKGKILFIHDVVQLHARCEWKTKKINFSEHLPLK